MALIRGLNVIVLAAALFRIDGAESPYTETRSTLEKWVETRQILSKTQAEWQSSKETLQQNIQLFERELHAVQEQVSKLSTNNSQIEKERKEAQSGRDEADAGLKVAQQFAASLEEKLRALLPQLPLPLQDILKPLYLKLPSDPNTRMTAAERLQVIVGILNEVDKFNSGISVFNEKRRNEKSEEMAVETVYVGLGAAYFVNESGEFGGVGAPGPNGWDWKFRPEVGPAVRDIIRIYRNEHPARFVSLPVTVH